MKALFAHLGSTIYHLSHNPGYGWKKKTNLP